MPLPNVSRHALLASAGLALLAEVASDAVFGASLTWGANASDRALRHDLLHFLARILAIDSVIRQDALRD